MALRRLQLTRQILARLFWTVSLRFFLCGSRNGSPTPPTVSPISSLNVSTLKNYVTAPRASLSNSSPRSSRAQASLPPPHPPRRRRCRHRWHYRQAWNFRQAIPHLPPRQHRRRPSHRKSRRPRNPCPSPTPRRSCPPPTARHQQTLAQRLLKRQRRRCLLQRQAPRQSNRSTSLARFGDVHAMKGPYPSERSVALIIARELLKEIVKRDGTAELPG